MTAFNLKGDDLIMLPEIYTLPTISFVGGSTQKLAFHIYDEGDKEPLDATSYEAAFSVIDYVHKWRDPIFTKTMTISDTGDKGTRNILVVELVPSDTVDLAGKYVYQISVKDQDGNVDIPDQGILFITKNIHKSFID